MNLIRCAIPVGLVCLLLTHLQYATHAQAPTFTQSQATEGRKAYREHCAGCHGAKLEGIDVSPALVGQHFDLTWGGKSAAELYDHIRRMPPEDPGTLSDEIYLNTLAYILKSNDFNEGSQPLPSDPTLLAGLTIPKNPDLDSITQPLLAGAAQSSPLLKNLPALTDEILANPSPNDWLAWNRTNNAQGYSPLTQINKQNVIDLKKAWSIPLPPGDNNPAPLIHNGVMYFFTYPDTAMAIDASNGTVLWRYQHKSEARPSHKMGLALHGDKVIIPTSDLHLVALNAKTGAVVWDHKIAAEKPARGQWELRSAPLVAGDKVFQGITALWVPKGGFIVAVDINTGEESWRFNTIARPGEPGGNTWNGLAIEDRNGGSVWCQGSYDPELNLVYFGAAPTYDTGPLLNSVNKPGITNDALYTNATLALDRDTGELVWYYQHLPNDQWDLDWVFERQIIELPIDGEMRKAVITVGKMAILDALDAATGEYLFSMDMGLQNVVTAIDPETGEKTISPDAVPSRTKTQLICPNHFGARSWPPSAYNPNTRILYMPLTEGCMDTGPEGYRLLSHGVGLAIKPFPDTDNTIGRLYALDLEKQQLAWSRPQPFPIISGNMVTAGGLVFSGDLNCSLRAFDDTTGEILWETRLDDKPSSTIVTYSAQGKQYIATVIGQTNNHVKDLTGMYRKFARTMDLPANDAPTTGAAIWAFALE